MFSVDQSHSLPITQPVLIHVAVHDAGLPTGITAGGMLLNPQPLWCCTVIKMEKSRTFLKDFRFAKLFLQSLLQEKPWVVLAIPACSGKPERVQWKGWASVHANTHLAARWQYRHSYFHTAPIGGCHAPLPAWPCAELHLGQHRLRHPVAENGWVMFGRILSLHFQWLQALLSAFLRVPYGNSPLVILWPVLDGSLN